MNNNVLKIKITRLSNFSSDINLPAYATQGSSGLDLCAAIESAISILPGGRVTIPCGFQLELHEGYEAQIRPRSGLAAKHGVTVLNTPGTIDSDYRGEVKVILINLGNEEFLVRRGDRIAQMVIAPVTRVELIEATSVNETERGAGGFGHTGK